jgi:hypothetical protein
MQKTSRYYMPHCTKKGLKPGGFWYIMEISIPYFTARLWYVILQKFAVVSGYLQFLF